MNLILLIKLKCAVVDRWLADFKKRWNSDGDAELIYAYAFQSSRLYAIARAQTK